jgi:hypothetical protein
MFNPNSINPDMMRQSANSFDNMSDEDIARMSQSMGILI